MEIVAKTKGGFLIEASTYEVREILQAVHGVPPNVLEIGQRIPAVDYASAILNIKKLSEAYEFTSLVSKVADFNKEFEKLQSTVFGASDLKV